MPQFELIKKDTQFIRTYPFAYLLLDRALISVLMVASKFKNLPIADHAKPKPLTFDKIRLECSTRSYSDEYTDITIGVFGEIIALVQLVQAAWTEETRQSQTPDFLIQQDTLRLAQEIFPREEITHENMQEKITEYTRRVTHELLDKIRKPQNITQLEQIYPKLLTYFPNIDQLKLRNTMISMRNKLNHLIQFSGTLIKEIHSEPQIEMIQAPHTPDYLAEKDAEPSLKESTTDSNECKIAENKTSYSIIASALISHPTLGEAHAETQLEPEKKAEQSNADTTEKHIGTPPALEEDEESHDGFVFIRYDEQGNIIEDDATLTFG
jgi:hypothetical protein